ncbi:MAG: MjaI family restriction endonuclease [Armatimonadota bacterium]|nr:MjaI family restriction endonuclease [Armatimonadota bacterium]
MNDDRDYKTAALKNMVANRFQLNFKRNVGPTSQSIRECQPRSRDGWADYYYASVRPPKHIDGLGRIMYQKIHEEIIPALQSITVEECIAYMHELVIDKTYDGYCAEIAAVKQFVEEELEGYEVLPAPDEVDRTLAVDYYIPVGENWVGLQIKPVTVEQIPNLHEWQERWREGHEEFRRRYGGGVFTLVSVREGRDQKALHNPEVIQDIKAEIQRLEQ